MTRKEFMERLSGLLAGLPEEERQEALEYYEQYFEDAGPENEARTIRELGSPEKVAATIRENLAAGEVAYQPKRMSTGMKVLIAVMILVPVGLLVLIISVVSSLVIRYKQEDYAEVREEVLETTYYPLEEYAAEEILRLDWDLGQVEVNVEHGEVFGIRETNLAEDQYESSISNQTWHLKVDIPQTFTDKNWKMTITVPEKVEITAADIHVGSGGLELPEMTFQELDLEVNSGGAALIGVTILREGEISVGSGGVALELFTGHNIGLECNSGAIALSGVLTGENDLECGSGSVSLVLDRAEEEYLYEISCGSGTVKLGDTFYNSTDETTIRNIADSLLEIECGSGSVVVEFMQQ